MELSIQKITKPSFAIGGILLVLVGISCLFYSKTYEMTDKDGFVKTPPLYARVTIGALLLVSGLTILYKTFKRL